MTMRVFLLTTVLFLWTVYASAKPCNAQTLDTWTFGTLPSSGVIQGNPGDTIGWGYTATNNSIMDWLFVSYVASSNTFDHGTATLVFDFPVLAPSTSVTVPFDANTLSGLIALTWDKDAPGGFADTGTFTAYGSWYDGDPFAGGNYVGDDGTQSANFTARVGVTSTVPEPGVVSLLGTLSVMSVFALTKRRRALHWHSI